jgi:hypothetical protein
MDASFTPSERKVLVDRYWQIRDSLSHPHNKKLNLDEKREAAAARNRLAAEYAERLPFVPLSRCPFCDTALDFPMDSMGFDGPWWAKGPVTEFPEPAGCEHFRTLLGAVDFGANVPLLPRLLRMVLPGPGAPYVIPRMLNLDGFAAVISSLRFPEGQTGYAIAYFSEEIVHGAFLHQPWGREAYQVRNEDGEYEAWTVKNDRQDFDLRPWIDRGSVQWIVANDPALRLVATGACPYENLPGARQPQVIRNGRIELLDPPDDSEIDPFA